MGIADAFMLGMVAMSCLAASLFFLRFWRDTRDTLFLMFSISFAVEAINRTVLAFTRESSEGEPTLYVVRLLSYALILAGIVAKNMGPGRRG
jgi:uncharacterized membrane protein HdeD (DUF308 family)